MSPNLPTATEDISIFYDKAMLPGIYIEGRAIKPDSVIWDKKIKEANIIEVSVPNDFGLNSAERHKVNKYQDPKNDLRQTLELENIDIIPVLLLVQLGLSKPISRTTWKTFQVAPVPSPEQFQ